MVLHVLLFLSRSFLLLFYRDLPFFHFILNFPPYFFIMIFPPFYFIAIFPPFYFIAIFPPYYFIVIFPTFYFITIFHLFYFINDLFNPPCFFITIIPPFCFITIFLLFFGCFKTQNYPRCPIMSQSEPCKETQKILINMFMLSGLKLCKWSYLNFFDLLVPGQHIIKIDLKIFDCVFSSLPLKLTFP